MENCLEERGKERSVEEGDMEVWMRGGGKDG
jgi:hypothetical protein